MRTDMTSMAGTGVWWSELIFFEGLDVLGIQERRF